MKDRNLSLIMTAIILSIPITSAIAKPDKTNARAIISNQSIKSVSINPSPVVKSGLKTSPLNTQSAKLPGNIALSSSKVSVSSTMPNSKGQVQNNVLSFNKNTTSNGKPQGSVSQMVASINNSQITTTSTSTPKPTNPKSPSNKVTQAIASLNKESSTPIKKTESTNKLSVSNDFKSKLSALLSSKPTDKKSNSTNKTNSTVSVGKLDTNSEASQKLNSIFGNNSSNNTSSKNESSSSTSSSGSTAFVNPNAPEAPPLTASTPTTTPTNTPIIPDAPPLPTASSSTSLTPIKNTGGTSSSLQAQLTSKLESGLNTTTPTVNKPKPQPTPFDNVMNELKLKLSKK